MTEAELKSLAKFAAEFLDWKHWTEAQMGYESWEGPEPFGEILEHRIENTFFGPVLEGERCKAPNPFSAPILAHLAEQEMEKRGYEWEGHGKNMYAYNFQKASSKYIPMDYSHHENKFIALWSAIEQSGEK